MRMKIGTVLSDLLKQNGMTVKKLSSSSGVPASTIAEWKSNRTPKNPEQVLRVANALNVSLHYLLFGSEDKFEKLNQFISKEIFEGTYEIKIKKIYKEMRGK